MKKLVFIALFAILSCSGAYAADEVFERLMNTKCFKCEFGPGASASWDGPRVKVELDAFNNTLIYDSIDVRAGTARIIGNQGSADVLVLQTPQGLTFIETTAMGNITITTIFPEYLKDGSDFIVVQSRHMNLPSGPLPSQYHGTCKVWE